LIKSVREPFPPTALRRRQAQTVRDSSSSYKIDYVIVVKTFLNPGAHQNRITGSKRIAVFMDVDTLPIGGVAMGRVCGCSLRSRLVLLKGLRSWISSGSIVDKNSVPAILTKIWTANQFFLDETK
jgi:hypothetical protein